ncbi:MAG: polysaccharide export protein [Planctomycetes bacterium]|nr:polysaccharide export protein [Planctomycetota bacterium]
MSSPKAAAVRIAALVLSVNLWGCAFTERGTPLGEIAPTINQTLSPQINGLAQGDFLKISFPNSPQWTHEVRVGLDGKASFLGIPGQLDVQGLTTEALREVLESKYSEFLTQPRIGVFVLQFTPRPVMVIGDVGQPGVIPMDSNRLTLLQALARAGGHRKDTMDLKRVQLVRWDAQNQQQLRFNIDASLKHWGIGEAVLLQPNDLVFVPNRAIDEVDIWINNWIRRLIPINQIPGV